MASAEAAPLIQRSESSFPRSALKSSGSRFLRFQETKRFAFDGVSHIANFLNGQDGEGRELRPQASGINSCTSTVYGDRLCGTSEACLPLTQELSRRLVGKASMRSERPRTATALSQLSHDARFELLKEPYAEPLGPGFYDIQYGSPPLGPLDAYSYVIGATPARDPFREHRAFASPPRGALMPSLEEARQSPTRDTRPLMSEAHYLGSYIRPDYQGFNDKVPTWHRAPEWWKSSDRRADVADYRYSTRHSETRKMVPDQLPLEMPVDRSGRVTTVAKRIQDRPSAVPFMSKQVRTAVLPRARHNDCRLASHRSDEDPGGHGPGSYGHFTSLGCAKRKTYRLFGDAEPTRGSGPQPGVETGRQSAAFANTNRNYKFGPFSPLKTDSTLMRTL